MSEGADRPPYRNKNPGTPVLVLYKVEQVRHHSVRMKSWKVQQLVRSYIKIPSELISAREKQTCDSSYMY